MLGTRRRCEWALWGIDHMLPHYVKIHPIYEKSMDIFFSMYVILQKHFNIRLKNRCCRCPHVQGTYEGGVAWGTLPRDGAQEDA